MDLWGAGALGGAVDSRDAKGVESSGLSSGGFGESKESGPFGVL